MHPLQIVFIIMALLLGLYLALNGFLWLVSFITGRAIVYNSSLPATYKQQREQPKRALSAAAASPDLLDELLADGEIDEADEEADEQTASPDEADEQTDDRQTALESRLSDIEESIERIQLDRSREAVVELLVQLGWSVSDIRAIIKGDNAVISGLVAKAKSTLEQPEEAAQAKENLGQIVAMTIDPSRPARLVPVRQGIDGMRYTLDEAGQPQPLKEKQEEE